MTTHKNRDCGSHKKIGDDISPKEAIEASLKIQEREETTYLRRQSSEPDAETTTERLKEFDRLARHAAKEFSACTTKGSEEEISMDLMRAEKHVDLLRYPQDRLKWREAWLKAANIRARENRTIEIDLVVSKASRSLTLALAEIDFHYGLKYGDIRTLVKQPISAQGL